MKMENVLQRFSYIFFFFKPRCYKLRFLIYYSKLISQIPWHILGARKQAYEFAEFFNLLYWTGRTLVFFHCHENSIWARQSLK